MPPSSTAIPVRQPAPAETNLSDVQDIAEFKIAAQQRRPSMVLEFTEFLRNNRKWWLTPLMVILLFFSGLILLTKTAAAPFIYVLF